ncbi:PhoX family phosphatase [Paralimibaculum aggregatum]|uniref:PhoX family phosphatase n=1 Tax=Paralimibaculum aggregatum TaxID=3036245 RepID=A0ABQ6LJY7_9RHOB|nr:PhoX family phosphatase [Limibaculum sp. NKW23]GMG81982.1 PhoX family phosphatase [Limibaculum sp. NKW23]
MDRKQIVSDPGIGNRAEAYEAFDDIPTNPNLGDTIGDVIHRRHGRRAVMRGALAVSAATALFGTAALMQAPGARAAAGGGTRFAFPELAAGIDETHHIAEGYDARILLRWGDPVFADAPPFDPHRQSAERQLAQFGYNNDYVGFVPLDPAGRRGLLCVNHEYTNEEVMFPGLGRQDRADFAGTTKAIAETEMAAHGGTVVEIARGADGHWAVELASRYNRRITPLTTRMAIDGPAAGHDRMKTAADAAGTEVIGTLNNCAGGITPWGTYLMAEENFHGYFWTDRLDADGRPDLSAQPQAAAMKRYGVPGRWYAWGKWHERFNIDIEPNEPNRFGYIVEVDPLDPESRPVKHTALGRFRHEGAESIANPDGRVVIYSGDDNRFDYLYRFVSAGTIGADRAANMALLSEGTLSVARFNDDGSMDWLPLVHGHGPLTAENGFHSQADIAIDTRLAADLLGATPMDRPEDVQPGEGHVYVMLTNNTRRRPGDENAANPRPENRFGHIIELAVPEGDHAADRMTWEIIVKCGDPAIAEVGAQWGPATSENGWFGSPDNAAIDAMGRLWISTDQGSSWPRTGRADGLYALETGGEARGSSRLFFRCPIGAELCGPCFTADQETLFLAVQHPGTDGTTSYPGFERASTFEDPATRWPDFDPAMPPRPSVLVVTKRGGGRIAV